MNNPKRETATTYEHDGLCSDYVKINRIKKAFYIEQREVKGYHAEGIIQNGENAINKLEKEDLEKYEIFRKEGLTKFAESLKNQKGNLILKAIK